MAHFARRTRVSVSVLRGDPRSRIGLWDETGDSRARLARYGMVRAELQPEFAGLAPQRAVVVIRSETGRLTPELGVPTA